jgi:hypothetical protein
MDSLRANETPEAYSTSLLHIERKQKTMDIEEKEFEALQAEKRDRMNSRWQVWSILVGLAGAFGLASLQSGYTGYVVALFPILARFLLPEMLLFDSFCYVFGTF